MYLKYYFFNIAFIIDILKVQHGNIFGLLTHARLARSYTLTQC